MIKEVLNGVGQIHPADYNSRIRKIDRMFERELDFRNIKFPVKIRDLPKIEPKQLH